MSFCGHQKVILRSSISSDGPCVELLAAKFSKVLVVVAPLHVARYTLALVPVERISTVIT
jgi:hypothetical protein